MHECPCLGVRRVAVAIETGTGDPLPSPRRPDFQLSDPEPDEPQLLRRKWPIATGAILTASRRFRRIADRPVAMTQGNCRAAPEKGLAQAEAQRDHHVVTAAGFSS